MDIHIGTADPLYAGAAADRAIFIGAGWAEGGDLSWSPFDGGHPLLPAHPAKIWSFLSPFRLP